MMSADGCKLTPDQGRELPERREIYSPGAGGTVGRLQATAYFFPAGPAGTASTPAGTAEGQSMKLDGRALIEQGYSVILGRTTGAALLVTPSGSRMKTFEPITEGGTRRVAGELITAIRDCVVADLKAEIARDRDRKPAPPTRRPPRRRGKRADPLNLIGKDHTWPR